MEFQAKLRELEEKKYRKRKAQTRLQVLERQKRELEESITVYARQTAEEQADVEELTGRTLKGFLARLQKNTYKDKLTREEAEAAAALAKYETAQAALADTERQITEARQEVRGLKMAEREYENCLAERRAWLEAQEGAAAEEIARLEGEAEEIRGRKREVYEACTAGKRVEALAAQVDKELSEAQNWGNWDAWGGGGLLSDMAKYEHLDAASEMTKSLQNLIGQFRTELADVALCTDIDVEIDEFTRFADFFWDGFFVDFTVLDRIKSARWRIQDLQKELEKVMSDLRALRQETELALMRKEDQITDVIQNG